MPPVTSNESQRPAPEYIPKLQISGANIDKKATYRAQEGAKKPRNEDASTFKDLGNGNALMVLGDGVGGAIGGADASKALVSTVDKIVSENISAQTSEETVKRLLAGALAYANKSVYEIGGNGPTDMRPATTAVVGIIWHDKLIYANVGDSELSIVRNGKLTPLTQKEEHPTQNTILNSIGGEESLKLQQLGVLDLLPGDVLAMYSDGSEDAFKKRGADTLESVITRSLKTAGGDVQKAGRLISEAVDQEVAKGGKDDDRNLVLTRFDNNGQESQKPLVLPIALNTPVEVFTGSTKGRAVIVDYLPGNRVILQNAAGKNFTSDIKTVLKDNPRLTLEGMHAKKPSFFQWLTRRKP